MCEIVLSGFKVKNKFERASFFQKIFLVSSTIKVVILNILFLIFTNANMLFVEQKLTL